MYILFKFKSIFLNEFLSIFEFLLNFLHKHTDIYGDSNHRGNGNP